MRGLVKAAALLLAPVLASASSNDPVDAISPTFITLNIPLGVHKSTALTLRLDVGESDEICGPANVKINNQALSQNAQGGYTHGLLTLDDGAVIDASWVFKCIEKDSVPVEQLMSFTIKTFDNEPVLGVTFTASFKQTAPVFISEIDGAADVYQLAIPGTDLEDNDVEDEDEEVDGLPFGDAADEKETPGSDGELDAQLAELETLRIQAYQLEEMIRFKEMAILEKMGIPMPPPPPPPPSPLRECDTIKCIVRTLKHKVKHACGGMMGGFLKHWTHGHGSHGNQSWPFPPHRPSHHGPPPFCPPCHKQPHGPPHNAPPEEPPRNPPFYDRPPPPEFFDQHPPGLAPPPPPPGQPPKGHPHHDENPHAEQLDVPAPPMGGHERPLQSPPHHKADHPPHHDTKRPPPPPLHQDLIIIAGMAAIAFAAFSLIGIGYIHRRVVRLTPESRRALHHIRHHTREERRARRHNRKAARKAAIKAFFRHIFRCSDDDEEKEAMLRGRDASDEETTMEQEIAQFRAAASMVEGIVAAEEGRMHRSVAERREMIQHATLPPPPPRPPMVPYHAQSLYPGYVVEDVHLPTYDEETVDSSVVSDGCRYTPGTLDYTPSTTASNADDVLGDSKH